MVEKSICVEFRDKKSDRFNHKRKSTSFLNGLLAIALVGNKKFAQFAFEM